MKIGVNLFGLKVKLYHDFDGVISRLKSDGFTSVEICVIFGNLPSIPKEIEAKIPIEVLKEMSGGIWSAELADGNLKRVREHGLEVISCHLMFGMLSAPEEMEALIPQIVEFGKRNQISYFVLSLMKNLSEIKLYAPVVKQITEELEEVGIQLAYHNHEIECIPEEGTTAMDYLLEKCPKLKLEPDVGWLKFSGVSPVEFIKNHSDRIVLLHFKDICADASPETRDTCFTAIGEGSIPLAEILQVAKDCVITENGLIIDQDNSLTDILDDLKTGAENMKKYSK